MAIDRNKFVALSYELTSGSFSGEVKERATEESPLSFVYGAGLMLPKFEEHILGLKSGESYEFCIKSDDAYGPVFEDRIVDLPKDIFKVDGTVDESLLVVGNMVPMMDTSGNRLQGIVKNVADDEVTMDFNHPMAGEDLYFKGAVLEVRQATDEELAQAAGVNSGGCGSGCGCGSEANNSCGCGPEETVGASAGGSCGSGCGCH